MNFFFLKKSQIHMKDAEWAESKEKSYFRFSFFELWLFLYSNHPIFRWIFTKTQKIKIGKSIFHSIQHIELLSWKWEHNWGEERGSVYPYLGQDLVLFCRKSAALHDQWRVKVRLRGDFLARLMTETFWRALWLRFFGAPYDWDSKISDWSTKLADQ